MFEADQLRHFDYEEPERSKPQRFEPNSEEHEHYGSMVLRHFNLTELDREGPRHVDLAGALHFDYVVLDGEDPRRFDSAEPLDLVEEVDCPYFEIFLACLDL